MLFQLQSSTHDKTIAVFHSREPTIGDQYVGSVGFVPIVLLIYITNDILSFAATLRFTVQKLL